MKHSLYLMEAHTVRSDKFFEVYIEKDRFAFIKEKVGFFEMLLGGIVDAIVNSYPIMFVAWLFCMLFRKKQNPSDPAINRKFNLEKQKSKRSNFEMAFSSIQSVSVEKGTVMHKGWPYEGKIHFQLENADKQTFFIASSASVKSILDMFIDLQLPCNEIVA